MIPLIYLTIILGSLTTKALASCNETILFLAEEHRTKFLRWTNNSITLVCPAHNFINSLWYSEVIVYKMTVGCVSDEQRELNLNWFPDVSTVSALFTSERHSYRILCEFSSSNGIIKATVKKQHMPDSTSFRIVDMTVYVEPSKSLMTTFYICKKGEIRNGTCRNQFGNGTYYDSKKDIHTSDKYYKITNVLSPGHLYKHECFAKINGTYNIFTTTFLKDTNECEEADKEGNKLCEVQSSCTNRIRGYYCPQNTYTNSDLCKTKPGWTCPDTANYDFMSKPSCNVDKCIQAINLGLQLCDLGVHDCVDSPANNSYYCKQGVPFIDTCEILAKEYNWLCPTLSAAELDKIHSSQNLDNLLNNAQALNQISPHYVYKFATSITDENVRKQLARNSAKQRYQMANNLLNSFVHTVNKVPLSDTAFNITKNKSTSEYTTVKQKGQLDEVKFATSLFHLVAEIARQTPQVGTLLNSGEANRNGMQFMFLSPDARFIGLNDSNGNPIDIRIDSKFNDTHDVLVAVLPSSKLTPIDKSNIQTNKVANKMPLKNSSIFLINTIENSSRFSLSMHLDKIPTQAVSCQQMHKPQNGHPNLWSEENCETIIQGLHYQCRCVPKHTGTFAIALVYWLGQSAIPLAHLQVINLVNYVFALITIVALFLFLIFTRFIGVFRLDQFNIAFCLMLSAIVSLAIPHVTDQQPVLCTITAVTVCFFPLAAFSWKLIFGLNTLILILAPHSSYHDLVAKQRHCLTVIWIGYLIPAVIVATWFGYTGQISTSSLCIGPQELRWSFIGPITTVVIFNFLILLVVGFVLLRNYLVTRKSRINKSTHLLVLTQLMLTLGLPYVAIYIQLLDAYSMLIIVPIAMACTAVLMFLLVAVIDEENRLLFKAFLINHFARSSGQFNISQGHIKRRSTTSTCSNCRPSQLKVNSSEKLWSSARGSLYVRHNDGTSCKFRPKTRKELQNNHNSSGLSETRTSEIVFEPGWLHRPPLSTPSFQNRNPTTTTSEATAIIMNHNLVATDPQTEQSHNRTIIAKQNTQPPSVIDKKIMRHTSEEISSSDSSPMKSVII